MDTVRPEAVVFLIALAVVVLFGVIGRLRRGPIDMRQEHPAFADRSPVGYMVGTVLAALALVAAGVGWLAVFGGRVVARTWHRGQDNPV
jgi:hypothetical protein